MKYKYTKDNLQDFLEPIPESGCLIWEGPVDREGYGVVWHDKRIHRVVWELEFGNIPKDKSVCHTCDTPMCAQKHHLFLCTHSENMKDSERKGRKAKKLNIQQVRAIKSGLLNGRSQTDIAYEFGVHPSNISRINTGDAWVGV
jgi:hypothetical protein